jgi:hypothetical protein
MWMKVELSFDQMAQNMSMYFMVEFRKLATLESDINGAAILSSPIHSNGTTLFFSPRASEICRDLLGIYGGVECDPPPKQWNPNDWTKMTGFLAGDRTVLGALN